MNGINLILLATALLVAVSSVTSSEFPFARYASRYGYISVGPFGVGKVDAGQNDHSYTYNVNENGPVNNKYIHQSGTFLHRVPVAVPVVVPYGPAVFPGHGPYFGPRPFLG